MTEHARKYEDALASVKAAQHLFAAVVLQYRAREIGDDVFLAARKVHEDAQLAFDAAERTYIDACNASGEQ